MAGAADREGAGGAADAWEVDLDAPASAGRVAVPAAGAGTGHAASTLAARPGDGGQGPAGARAFLSGRRPALLGLAAVLGVLLLLPVLSPAATGQEPGASPSGRPGGTAVLAGRLPEPLPLNVPAELTTIAQGPYVSLRAGAAGFVLVSTPSHVVEPSGRRVPVPADPAAWLRDQPGVQVVWARSLTVSGRGVTQVDYRLAPGRDGRAPASFFCGLWDGNPASPPCSRVTPGSRVRATFVPLGDRLLLVEAFWREASSADGRMPWQLRQGYRELLEDLRLRAAPIVAT